MKINVLRLILSSLITIALCGLIIYLGVVIEENFVMQILGVIGIIYIFICVILNVVKTIKRNKQNTKLEQIDLMYNETVKYQEEAKDFSLVYKRVKTKIKLGYLYLFSILISLCLVLFAVFNVKELKFNFLMVFSVMLIYDIMAALVKVRIENVKPHKENDYKALYNILDKCKSKLNIKDHIGIILVNGDNIGIEQIKDKAYLLIGIGDLNSLTEDELENIIYHELAHLYNQDTLISSKVLMSAKPLFEVSEPILSIGFICLLFSDCAYKINYEVETFLHFIKLEREKKADLAVLEYGDKQIYINALAKSLLPGLQDNNRFHLNVYENEKPVENFVELYLSKRVENYLENKEMYDMMLYKTLQKKFDTHPSLKMRMEALNVESFEINYDFERSDEFKQAIDNANKEYNAEWLKFEKENWDKNREYHYLYYTKEFDVLKDKENLNLEEKMKLAYCYFVFHQNDKALDILNSIVEENPNNVFALKNRAMIKYSMNDLSCIEDYEKSSEIDNSLLEENNFYIGSILSNNGLEEELEVYRKKTLDIMKQSLKNANYSVKQKTKAYIDNDLTEEQVEYIHNELMKYSIIKEAYLLKHYINEEKYQYFLGIIFHKKAKDEEKKEIMDELFIFFESISEYRIIFNDLTKVASFKKHVKDHKIKNLIY